MICDIWFNIPCIRLYLLRREFKPIPFVFSCSKHNEKHSCMNWSLWNLSLNEVRVSMSEMLLRWPQDTTRSCAACNTLYAIYLTSNPRYQWRPRADPRGLPTLNSQKSSLSTAKKIYVLIMLPFLSFDHIMPCWNLNIF